MGLNLSTKGKVFLYSLERNCFKKYWHFLQSVNKNQKREKPMGLVNLGAALLDPSHESCTLYLLKGKYCVFSQSKNMIASC